MSSLVEEHIIFKHVALNASFSMEGFESIWYKPGNTWYSVKHIGKPEVQIDVGSPITNITCFNRFLTIEVLHADTQKHNTITITTDILKIKLSIS